MKTCLMTSEAPYIGGSSTSAWCLFKKLREKKLDAHLLMPSEPQIGFKPTENGVRIIDVPVIDPNVDEIKGRKAQKTVYLLEAFSTLTNIQPKIIHTHDFTTLRFAAAWKRNNPEVKLIHSFGSCQSVYIYVRSGSANSQDIIKLQFPPYKHPEESVLIHEPNYIIVKSLLELKIIQKIYGLKNVSNLYNGVDTNFFNPDVTSEKTFLKKLDVKSQHVIMSIAGSLSKPEKGLDLIVKAIPLIKKEIPDICYIIVGKVKPHKELEFGTQQELLSLIDKLDVKNNIKFLSNFLPRNLAKLYKASRIFLDPSIYGPINTTNLEALACETPVICSKSVGAGEIINKYNAGFVVDRDPKTWAELIVKLIKNEKKTTDMGKRGAKMILNHFSWNKISKKILEIYDKITHETVQ